MNTGKEQFEREFEAFLADEESRVAALYRKLPQPEPGARLDAAVRAMAHRALNPQLVATPRGSSTRRAVRWLPAFGTAAGIVLAAGIAYRLGVPEGKQNEYSRPSNEVIAVRPIDAPAPASEPPLSPPPPGEGSATAAPASKLKALPGFAGKVESPSKPAPAALQNPAAQAGASSPAGDADAVARAEEAVVAPKAFPEQDKSARGGTPEAEAVDSGQAMAKRARQSLNDREHGEDRKKEQAQLQDRLGFGAHVAPPRRSQRDHGAATAAAAASPPPPALAPAAPVAESPAAMASEANRAAAAPQPRAETARAPEAPAAAATTESKDAALRANAPPPAPKTAAPEPSSLHDEAPHNRAASPGPETLQRADAQAPAGAAAPANGRADRGIARDAREQKAPMSTDPNARLYPEHWLENIRTMLRENHRGEALRSLEEFRRTYPDYALPDDLRDLK